MSWRALVAEALRRRKAERLTQREHAVLASVSVPTIAAFDRGETTLTLTKAFDILRVVGLLEEPGEEGEQDVFVREALARWRSLADGLPRDSPGRFPHGWYRFDYCLEGELKAVDLAALAADLEDAASGSRASWPAFRVAKRPDLAPYEFAGAVECWFPPDGDGIDRAFSDPAHCDFWRADPSGRLFLIRGYREDGAETFPPGTILDTTFPTREIADVLSHAGRLAKRLRKDDASPISVRFRALYTGLSGRVLRAWANPFDDLLDEGHAPRGDEAALEAVVPAEDIEGDLARHVYPLVASLYERFGVTGLSMSRVGAEIDRFLAQSARPPPRR